MPPHTDGLNDEDLRPKPSTPSKDSRRYRLKPVEVDVRRFPDEENADLEDLSRWCNGHVETRNGVRGIAIHTRDHLKFASKGCVILRQPYNGKCSILTVEDFEARYERVYGYR